MTTREIAEIYDGLSREKKEKFKAFLARLLEGQEETTQLFSACPQEAR